MPIMVPHVPSAAMIALHVRGARVYTPCPACAAMPARAYALCLSPCVELIALYGDRFTPGR